MRKSRLNSNHLILVVDDQPSMCWILSRVLKESGFEVEVACDAQEAMSIISSETVSAAIIDYRLPDSNGLQLLNRIRKTGSKIPAILITSYGSKALRSQAAEAGFACYFDKPFNNKSLLEALNKTLDR